MRENWKVTVEYFSVLCYQWFFFEGHLKCLISSFTPFNSVWWSYHEPVEMLVALLTCSFTFYSCWLCLVITKQIFNWSVCFTNDQKRILGEVSDKVEEVLALVFENYKSLDETLLSGLTAGFKSATGIVPPAIAPAIKLYGLLHDILSPEARLRFCKFFQV